MDVLNDICLQVHKPVVAVFARLLYLITIKSEDMGDIENYEINALHRSKKKKKKKKKKEFQSASIRRKSTETNGLVWS